MTELEEYKKCLEDIELYRCKREQIERDQNEINQRIKQLMQKNPSADLSLLQQEIEQLNLLDEEYGAKMHALTIKRNLLEP